MAPAAWSTRDLFFCFPKDIVSQVVTLKLWQFAQRLALLFPRWEMFEVRNAAKSSGNFALGSLC